MTTVLIADDQPLQRFGFRMLLESQDDLTVLGESTNGSETVRMTAELHPDVVLMDVRMPGLDGIQATRHIIATGDRTRVLILTTFDLNEYAYAHHLPTPETRPGPDPRLAPLTDREREILTVIGKGWTNTEIATRLHLAESTVKTHVSRILAKTGSRDRIQAVILAYDTKLVSSS
ncbi:DNA-binding response regulator [Streptomyces spinoverrucosus]|uniref:DNA-binding response regulator n=1 Tax=Streptomyces spinoverrucosus TaxID=284043 RepID=A0A4Y3VVJ8_9ACTN|nr:response regulator transcription factor [Streptomyces spinoverrucosus]GEC09761.1 DNA-binding response regulator [Streptomyces spinoverrucosus]GHB52170.1 DNA-binding response regulator [Streptomyces spinoverrucosus]